MAQAIHYASLLDVPVQLLQQWRRFRLRRRHPGGRLAGAQPPILTYFNAATHIGLTATPKETADVSNTDYFGEPVPEEKVRIVARVSELRHLCAELRQRLAAAQATQSHLADALVEQSLA